MPSFHTALVQSTLQTPNPINSMLTNAMRLTQNQRTNTQATQAISKLPITRRYKRILWPTLRVKAFRALDLSEFDIIISNSNAEAKAVRKTRPGQIHIAYIHTPISCYWRHYEEFRREFKFGPFTTFVRPVITVLVKKMRKLDLDSVKDIDILNANSEITRDRIKQYYKRSSTVVHPPVDVDCFTPPPKGQRSGYILWGSHVPYKRFDLAVQAANQLDAQLTIVGSGPDTARLKKLAGPTVKFVGRVSDKELVRLAQSAKGFLLPKEEDFGISAVEALATGTPVIAYSKGGTLDIVQDGETGVLFNDQTVESLVAAMKRFEALTFLPATLHRKAKRFDKSLFNARIKKIVRDAIQQ